MRAPAPPPSAPPRPQARGALRLLLVALGALSFGSALCALAVAGCTSTLPFVDCGPLPDRNGCPARGGGTCEDRTCSALYECGDAGWQLVESCPLNGQGASGAAGSGGAAGSAGAAGAAGAAGSACDAAPSTPPDGLPCDPLQAPECDEGIALNCPDRACLTGCAVFLRCEGGEWQDELAAYCDDETGELVVNPTLEPRPAPALFRGPASRARPAPARS